MVSLSALDLSIIFSLFTILLLIGTLVGKSAGKNTNQYFLSGRNMPWWLLGISMVATTFSTDTPNLVTDLVRTHGVSGNWVWWAFLLTGLLTVFVYAKLWRNSEVSTDIAFYKLRYGGRPSRFLRSFRALYLGIAFNVLAMAGVSLAAIKIGQVMLGFPPLTTILIAGTTTVFFSTIGGFKGVVYTDFILFFVAMIGAFGAAYYIVELPEIGGLEALIRHENVRDKLAFFPSFEDPESLIVLLVIPLAVQWWSSWYPGSEPGGGGYIAQRMLSAKDENHAIGATFFYNVMHYALRPWPWIVVALASLVLFPDLASIQEAFPRVTQDKLGHDLAYSAMLTKLPNGLLGLVLASLAAAYMSTLSTHLNWGASYIVNDFYQRVKPNASEKHLVNVGRIATVVLMVLSSWVALSLTHALQLFEIILMFGAGTGLIFILRWFWWRMNAWTEISAMITSGLISIGLTFSSVGELFFGVGGVFPSYLKFPFVVISSTIVWLIVTFVTAPETDQVLFDFYKKTQPNGPGWRFILLKAKKAEVVIVKTSEKWNVPNGLMAMFLGVLLIYSCLFAVGNFIYGEYELAIVLCGMVLIFSFLLVKRWKKMKGTVLES